MDTRFRKSLAMAVLAVPFAFVEAAQGASLSFVLDQSDALADGVGYLKVTVADGTGGDVDFTVERLDALGGNAGIQSFAFNVAPGGSAEAVDVHGLPEGWSVRDGYRMDGFGLFDIKLYGGGGSVGTLSFSIAGVDFDEIGDYASLSTGKAPEGHAFFAARVAGLVGGSDSALVANATAVPLPTAGWLAVACVAVASRFARRRGTRAGSVVTFAALCSLEWLKRRLARRAPVTSAQG